MKSVFVLAWLSDRFYSIDIDCRIYEYYLCYLMLIYSVNNSIKLNRIFASYRFELFQDSPMYFESLLDKLSNIFEKLRFTIEN